MQGISIEVRGYYACCHRDEGGNGKSLTAIVIIMTVCQKRDMWFMLSWTLKSFEGGQWISRYLLSLSERCLNQTCKEQIRLAAVASSNIWLVINRKERNRLWNTKKYTQYIANSWGLSVLGCTFSFKRTQEYLFLILPQIWETAKL